MKKGDIVYAYKFNLFSREEPTTESRIRQEKIISLGKAYITTENERGYKAKYDADIVHDSYYRESNFFVYGLFPSKQAIYDYLEKEKIARDIQSSMFYNRLIYFSLEDVKVIKSILDKYKINK